MLIDQRPRAALGQIAFPFERLPVAVGACYGTVVGTAHVAYDGHGPWWVTQIEVSSPQHYGPDVYLPVSHPLWREICERLDQYRGDDVDEAIERALADGAHMRLFDEHRPRASVRSSPPPHARRSFRLIALDRLFSGAGVAFSTTAELVCIGAFLAGFAVWSVPDLPPRATPTHHAVSVASRSDVRS